MSFIDKAAPEAIKLIKEAQKNGHGFYLGIAANKGEYTEVHSVIAELSLSGTDAILQGLIESRNEELSKLGFVPRELKERFTVDGKVPVGHSHKGLKETGKELFDKLIGKVEGAIQGTRESKQEESPKKTKEERPGFGRYKGFMNKYGGD